MAEEKPRAAELSSAIESSATGANAGDASRTCPHCATVMPASAAFCPACGWSMRPLPPGDRLAAAFAYFTFVPAAAFLLLPAFRTHRFVRFHAWQSLLIWAVFLVLSVVAVILSNIAAAMVFLLFGVLALLAMGFLWLALSIKAWQGERFELPWFGALAARMR